MGLTLQMRRCLTQACPHGPHPHRPAHAGRLALPKHELGLEVIAGVGPQRSSPHRSVPARPQAVRDRRVAVAPRTGTTLLERSDALVALALQDPRRLRRLPQVRGRLLVALDGLHPEVGPAVLGVRRAGLAGAVLGARRVRSAPHDALAPLVHEGPPALPGPIVGGLTDGHPSIRAAVAQALPGVPPPLGQCHS
jgi:hypothetical protein